MELMFMQKCNIEEECMRNFTYIFPCNIMLPCKATWRANRRGI